MNRNALLGVFILLLLMTVGSVSAENVTVEMGGIVFDAPVTHNNTTDFTKLDDGSITWAYEDYENGVSVYVCDERPFEYDVQERYDELSGFNQMRPIGDKWFVVCADSPDDKDMCFLSAHAKDA